MSTTAAIDRATVQETKTRLSALLVEDNLADSELVLRELQRGGFEVSSEVVQTAADFRRKLQTTTPDVILADYNLGSWRGMEALEILRTEGRDIPLILVSGAVGDVTAVECIKQGATDYVLKDALARLPVSIRRALREKQTREERRQAELELARKVEELARSNRDLEQFAYVASHDLQEPLRMVAAYTQLLKERYADGLDENANKYIHYALEGALRMQTLVQDLLTFSRVGRNRQRTHLASDAVVQEALQNLQAALQESGAVVHYDNLPVVTGDRTQLVQLFQNLIGNAIKFHGEKAPVITVSAKKLAAEWAFSVSDNGIGIAAEHLEAVFVIFQRLHTRAEYPGNGVGLAICKKIVEQHGGRIWVESKAGEGASFKFTLPACPADGEGNHTDERRA
ncbi:putative Histidine kinase [Candidatus Sulfotelmatobacter kueseliae]|jgi:signal transduction histidine kinase|uniref:histidine kinase n=1 Tax=Candidatus Sulfotelmatobacter kueseliae TaxID=2042962 RepID=A0A2U3K813_9BACT|nr:putative Histidine kinase [Candidatus Sulfotelmatobacter kueseliae]